MEIILTSKANTTLSDLIDVLEDSYTSRIKAFDYIDRIKEEIRYQIELISITQPPKAGVKYNSKKYGYPTNYIRYKANANTTWYILIRIYEQTVFVTYIYNNNNKLHSIAKTKR